MIKRFYKDDEGWFIDLPDLIKDGTFTKANLAMVLGADTLLDKLYKLTKGIDNEVTVRFEDYPITTGNDLYKDKLILDDIGYDKNKLIAINHPVQTGGYYHTESDGHKVWLCAVCAHLFKGVFPGTIYFQVYN
jgi:hypothetical protein